jgi:predicted transcriptional regulator
LAEKAFFSKGGEAMATVEELVKQYETDEKLQKEVEAILADGKITFMEFVTFAKKHHVNISPADFPKYVEEAKKLGFVK